MANVNVGEAQLHLLSFILECNTLAEAAKEARVHLNAGDVDGAVAILAHYEDRASQLGHILEDNVLGNLDTHEGE